MKKNILIFFILLPVMIWAQSEFTVNTYSDSTQRDPQIAMDASGNYVIVWDSEDQVSSGSQSDIYMQKYDADDNKIDNEILVNNQTDREQERPAVAMAPDGSVLVVWASHTGDFSAIYDIRGKFFPDGGTATDEFTIAVNDEYSQTNPEIAVDKDGNFVVAWESWFTDGSDRGVYARYINSDGTAGEPEFQVNNETMYSQAKPAVRFFDNGNYIIVWESFKQDQATPSGYGVYGKIFAPDGSVVKDEFQVNTYVNDYQWFADVETFTDGSFIITWCSWVEDGHDGGIYMQKFDGSGEKSGDEIRVNRTTDYYQWLPKIRKFTDAGFAIVWSSWQQDGSREGVYVQTYNDELDKISFETRINEYTNGYQWEPTFVTGENSEILVTWACWYSDEIDYEVVARRVTPIAPQGTIKTGSYQHPGGSSSSMMFVHVVDSTALTGNEYEVTFEMSGETSAVMDVKNITTNQTMVNNFPINRGENTLYLTDVFEGVAVEIIPEFDLALDIAGSEMVNNSGTNIIFSIGEPSGTKDLAPIDIAVEWGNTDTLSNGQYSEVLDTAYSVSGIKEVMLPFVPWNLTDDERIETFIIESGNLKNNRWDPGEDIIFLTPPQYNPAFPVFHAQLINDSPTGTIVLPGVGDTNFVRTTKPLSDDDVFTFVTDPAQITGTDENGFIPDKFELSQNYPNPFNPATKIEYSIPSNGMVRLSVYNILGEQVKTLVNHEQKAGPYRVSFDASTLASGVYFYTLQSGSKNISKKMMLLK